MSSATPTPCSDASATACAAGTTLPWTASSSTSRSYEEGPERGHPRSGSATARAAKKARTVRAAVGHYCGPSIGESNTTLSRIDRRSVMVRRRLRPKPAGDVAHDGERLPEPRRRIGAPGDDGVRQRDRRVELAARDESSGVADVGERGRREHDAEPPLDGEEQVARI